MAITQPLNLMHDSSWKSIQDIKIMHTNEWRTVKYGWIMDSGAWKKIYDYTTNAVLYGTSNYAFTPNGNNPFQQTGLYAGYGVPGDWSEAADGLIIYNSGYGSGTPAWVGKMITIPNGCTSVQVKCTCDNGGTIYFNQTALGSVPHMSWAYYTKAVCPNDVLYVSLVNGGGSKYNGEVVRIDDLTGGNGTILKTDLTWIGGGG